MRIIVLIDLPPSAPYHRATLEAITHAAEASGTAVEVSAIRTDRGGSTKSLSGINGVVVGPGSPYRDEPTVWEHVRAAREQGVPLVGT